MTKEIENRILLLYAILELGRSDKKTVLNFIIDNDLIILNEEDNVVLTSRKEIKWRNELAFVRQHLVEMEALNKYEWSITPIGRMYYNSLIQNLEDRDTNYALNRIKKLDVLKPIKGFNIKIIDDIYKNEELTNTDIEAIVLCRKGQGIFRKNLVKLWGKCSATNYPDTTILIASHIKPWRNSSNRERLDKYNGLLLTPNLDKLFDKGLITFNFKDGQIIISEKIKETETLGIHEKMQIKLFEENKIYLEYHNQSIFKK